MGKIRLGSILGTTIELDFSFVILLVFWVFSDLQGGVKYALLYPEDIRLYGLSFDSRLGRATRLFGELAYRPNQPLSINFADLADAFVARNPNSILNRPASGKNALALPPGATFDAYDRFAVTTASIGVNQGLPGLLGSQRMLFAAELGVSHIANLPDASVIRYGRSEAYGVGAVPGVPCIDSFPGKTCALQGFVTNDGWNARKVGLNLQSLLLADLSLTGPAAERAKAAVLIASATASLIAAALLLRRGRTLNNSS